MDKNMKYEVESNGLIEKFRKSGQSQIQPLTVPYIFWYLKWLWHPHYVYLYVIQSELIASLECQCKWTHLELNRKCPCYGNLVLLIHLLGKQKKV